MAPVRKRKTLFASKRAHSNGLISRVQSNYNAAFKALRFIFRTLGPTRCHENVSVVPVISDFSTKAAHQFGNSLCNPSYGASESNALVIRSRRNWLGAVRILLRRSFLKPSKSGKLLPPEAPDCGPAAIRLRTEWPVIRELS